MEPADLARWNARYPKIAEVGGADAPGIDRVEWKPLGQDVALQLREALSEVISLPHEPDSIMTDRAMAFAVHVPRPTSRPWPWETGNREIGFGRDDRGPRRGLR